MNESKVSSKQFSLNWQDALRGLIMAVGGAVFAVVQSSIETGNFHFDWPLIAKIAGGAALTYIAKNFFQPAVIQTPVTKEEVKDSTLQPTAK